MKLRQGKTKSILQSSMNSALLAVEVYNKPRSTFRSECYITLMIMAWMRLFHAHFHHSIGDKYYHKKGGKWEIVDGERKAWEVGFCIKKCSKLKPSVIANLEFFIGLRNKIEHRHVDKKEVDTSIFGECQALLYNYENTLVEWFGEEYAINENLAHSLQFSKVRSQEQRDSSKSLATQELKNIRKYIDDYRSALSEDVFQSQEYSIKVLQIPKISNTNRSDLAIEFINLSALSDDDKAAIIKLTAIVKDKKLIQEAVNIDKYKPGVLLARINERLNLEEESKITHHHHRCLYFIFSVRPIASENLTPTSTNTKYCFYDATHGDYVYTQQWEDFLHSLFTQKGFSTKSAVDLFNSGKKLNALDYEQS